jgi:hypothetical protein
MKKKTSTARRAHRSKHARNRELVDTGKDKRYIRRNAKGEFEEVDNLHRSLSQDRRRKAKTSVRAGQGDRGDRRSQ